MDYSIKEYLPFTYATTITLGSGAQGQTQIVLAADSYFQLLRFVARSSVDADNDVMPNNFSVLISDQSTGRLLSNIRIPQSMLVTSTYTDGAEQKYPVTWNPQATIILDFLELSGGSNTITFGMQGYKLFRT